MRLTKKSWVRPRSQTACTSSHQHEHIESNATAVNEDKSKCTGEVFVWHTITTHNLSRFIRRVFIHIEFINDECSN